jgi:hypothetical protein
MASEGKDSEKKNLEIRLTNIENKLNELVQSRGAMPQAKASAEDIETFQKVLRAAQDDWWDEPKCSHCIPTYYKLEEILERIRWWVECQPGWPGRGGWSGRAQFREFGR